MNIVTRYTVTGRTVEDLEKAAELRLAEFAAGRIGLVVALDATPTAKTGDGNVTHWTAEVVARVISPGHVVIAVTELASLAVGLEHGASPEIIAGALRAFYADEVAP